MSGPTGTTGPATAAASRATARSTPLRLARIHLRLGSLSLARAELESLAGRGMLDEDALLDLAEVRWRTGDLAGAGEAANALLERGRNDPIALVIAAEAVAALGRPSEARRLATRAVEAADVPLDALFAGMPMSAIWPGEPAGPAPGPAPRATTVAGSSTPAPAAAAEAFAGGRGALARGDRSAASLRLGVAMRLEPEYAQAVLDAVGPRPEDPALALVAGDALRLLGREAEARAAFDLARGGAPAPSVVASSGPPAGAARPAGAERESVDDDIDDA